MIQTTSIRTGVIGAGLMGYWHADTVHKAGGQLVAVVDPNIDVAQGLAKQYRSVKTFSTTEQMIEEVPLDILHICTPSNTHQSIAEKAIDAGIHVLIEKPVTPKGSDTEALLERASRRGVLLCPIHQFLFQDGVRNAKAWLPRIGELVHLEATFCSAGGMSLTPGLQDAVVADILPHPLSLMQGFLPNGILPEDWTGVKPRLGEFRGMGEIGGISASMFISMHGRPTECGFRVVGTQGTIHLDLFHGYGFYESGAVSKVKKIFRPFDLATKRLGAATVNLGRRVLRGESAYPGLQQLVSAFYRAVRTHAPLPISEVNTLAVARIRDALIGKSGVAAEALVYQGS